MQNITIGQLMGDMRKARGPSAGKLTDGLCARRTLQKIEENQAECDLLLFTVLLQRMGKSPDKLEYILSWQEYRKQCMQDFFMECVFKKNRRWAEATFQLYQRKTENAGRVHKMYVCRSRAMMAYWIDGDSAAAQQWLEKALDITFAGWRGSVWNRYAVSVMELENVLALVRVRRELGIESDGLLRKCGAYIAEFVTDEDEHAGIYSKYAWLMAEGLLAKGRAQEALKLCAAAFEELCRCDNEYFMRPLLEQMLRCYSMMSAKADIIPAPIYGERSEQTDADGAYPPEGNMSGKRTIMKTNEMEGRMSGGGGIPSCMVSRERCLAYLRTLEHMHEKYGKSWYPKTSLFYNCCRKLYHLDYEVIAAQRRALGMTQEKASRSVYQSEKTFGKVERGESAPHGKNFAHLMHNLGMREERKRGFVVTDSFETLELCKKIQKCVSREQYDIVIPLLRQMEQQLDMEISENRRVICFMQNIIDRAFGIRPLEKLLKENWNLLNETYVLAQLDNGRCSVTMSAGKKKKCRKDEYYRAPLRLEADVINQIVILLVQLNRKDEAKKLYECMLRIIEHSRENKLYRYSSYGVLLTNAASVKKSIEDSMKMLHYSVFWGKLDILGKNLMTIACALAEDSANKEVCREMVQEAYCLFGLSCHYCNQIKIKKYYAQVYGGDVEASDAILKD